ncbi:MAG: hypothetical protein M3Y87_09130 [Myxococcota bacterium]|nr:hypothetical protein [Myxococcota bacterium]
MRDLDRLFTVAPRVAGTTFVAMAGIDLDLVLPTPPSPWGGIEARGGERPARDGRSDVQVAARIASVETEFASFPRIAHAAPDLQWRRACARRSSR